MQEAVAVTEPQLKMAENGAKVGGRLENVLVHNLIHGLYSQDDWARVQGQAAYLDVDLSQPHAVLAVQSRPERQDATKKLAIQFNGHETLWSEEAGLRAMVVQTDQPDQILQLVQAHFSGATQPQSPDVSVGIGRVVASLEDYPNSWYQAVAALKLGQMSQQADQFLVDYEDFVCGNVTSIDSLGTYSLMFSSSNHQELRRFHKQQLSKLIDYSGGVGGDELIHTLRVALRSRSYEASAEILSMHINTLKYRLKRVNEIAGLSSEELREDGDVSSAVYNALLIDQALPIMDILERICWRG